MKKLLALLMAITMMITMMMLLMTACGDDGYNQTATTAASTTQITTATTSYEDYQWQQKYGDLPTAREVQYDKWGHFGDCFTISGTAELDDYYNWGYKNYEYGYFCIRIRPTGGSYSDEWYVYASRSKFADLYNGFLSGSKSVTLVAQLVQVETGSNNMATLVDYKN